MHLPFPRKLQVSPIRGGKGEFSPLCLTFHLNKENSFVLLPKVPAIPAGSRWGTAHASIFLFLPLLLQPPQPPVTWRPPASLCEETPEHISVAESYERPGTPLSYFLLIAYDTASRAQTPVNKNLHHITQEMPTSVWFPPTELHKPPLNGARGYFSYFHFSSAYTLWLTEPLAQRDVGNHSSESNR